MLYYFCYNNIGNKQFLNTLTLKIMTTRELLKLISDCKESKCIFDLVRLSNKISKIKLNKKNEKIWFEFLENI